MHCVRHLLDTIVVVWVDTGAAYPETYAHMAQVERSVPWFYTAKSNQPKDIADHGYPSDIVPVRNDVAWNMIVPGEPVKIQSTFQCCAKNMWMPLDKALKDLEVDICLMGNRADETLTDKRWNKQMNGIEFIYPLRDWNLERVQNYVKTHKLAIPAYYETEEKSRDCWNCTGYLWEKKQAIKNLPPEMKIEVMQRLDLIARAIGDELNYLRALINDND